MPDSTTIKTLSLSLAAKGFRGRVARVGHPASVGDEAELERRLIEMGFIEGARVQLLHEGFIGRDPIAVRVDDTTVAVRRRDARLVLVDPED
ncbi:MAG: ferrous iron transport protein A [Alphaproteobacteria bacterium]|nr:ferrous iron transport protein A [Alphaproteobacteria bacterium]